MELFTSVDAMLPDSAAVRRLVSAGVPVIPVSEMTLEELAPLVTNLGLKHAMILEAGGAIARWKNNAWELEPCGLDADDLLDIVGEIEDRSGASLLVYSALSEHEALQRRFSEPFVIEHGDPDAVQRAANSLGFSIRRGRRFLHLSRSCDVGKAFTRLCDELQCTLTVGIGSSPLDAEFLVRADVPLVTPDADPELLAQVPHARVLASSDWAAAVEELVAA